MAQMNRGTEKGEGVEINLTFAGRNLVVPGPHRRAGRLRGRTCRLRGGSAPPGSRRRRRRQDEEEESDVQVHQDVGEVGEGDGAEDHGPIPRHQGASPPYEKPYEAGRPA